MRYYVLNMPGSEEVVRVSRGSAMYFDTSTQRWIADPLLAVEVRLSEDWREVSPEELPPALTRNAPDHAIPRKSGLRRGRHSRR